MNELLSSQPGRPNSNTLRSAAYIVVILAGSWWLLGQLSSVLRPILLAVFLAFVLMPGYFRLRRAGLPAPLVIIGLAGIVAVVLLAVAQITYTNARELHREYPVLQQRLRELVITGTDWTKQNAPWLPMPDDDIATALSESVQPLASSLLSFTAGGILEAAVVVLYLLFILLGVESLPSRVSKAYPGEQGERILGVAANVNAAISGYLRAKIVSSILLAAGVGIVLAAFGVKFVFVWMLLTFLCNFIPYIGSFVAYLTPVLYASLQLPPWTAPLTVAGLLACVHLLSSSLVEPMLIGKAVGLSPLLILAALAVWGSIWGLPGMFLAVPLAVVIKIILKNIDATRQFALLAEE